MELRIRDSQMILDEAFGHWLIPIIKTKLISNIRKYKFNNWDEYLTSSTAVARLYDRKYTAAEVVIFAAKNLVCKGASGEIVISFDNTKFVPGFDRLRLNTIIKTINYGTLEVKQCSIFTDTLNHFADNIDKYVSLYYNF